MIFCLYRIRRIYNYLYKMIHTSMSSEDQQGKQSWIAFVRFRKQTLIGKIIFICSILLFGTVLVFNFFAIALQRWNTLGIYSIWVFFGWVFFVVLFYVSGKLVNMFIHKRKTEIQELNNKHPLKNDE